MIAGNAALGRQGVTDEQIEEDQRIRAAQAKKEVKPRRHVTTFGVVAFTLAVIMAAIFPTLTLLLKLSVILVGLKIFRLGGWFAGRDPRVDDEDHTFAGIILVVVALVLWYNTDNITAFLVNSTREIGAMIVASFKYSIRWSPADSFSALWSWIAGFFRHAWFGN